MGLYSHAGGTKNWLVRDIFGQPNGSSGDEFPNFLLAPAREAQTGRFRTSASSY